MCGLEFLTKLLYSINLIVIIVTQAMLFYCNLFKIVLPNNYGPTYYAAQDCAA